MSDMLVRAISSDGFVKAAAVVSTELTERARGIHHTMPVGTAALGRALAAASMMGNAMKGEGESVTLQFKGGGPLGTVLAVSDAEGNVRGYVTDPTVDLPLREDGKLDVGAAVGAAGTLTVVKDLGMREPYVGTVDLLGGEIAEDVAAYFAESEQIPSACGLGVLIDRDQSVKAAGGYLIQLLPGAGEDVITKVEGGIYAAESVTKFLSHDADAEALLRHVMPDFELKFLEASPISYRCYCSRERVERALLSLGAEELRQLREEQGQAEMTCQFCDRVYRFSAEELRSLEAAAKKP
ncbi:MAG: Hsp33 family molecular chaperone HslO [Oscillospiraceae bacterium]